MKPVVAILAPGTMGAAVGARLASRGVEVLTALEGRSSASRERARAAGMTGVAEEQLAAADYLLSIVPPAIALAFAERMAATLGRARRKPIFVDCNAVSPATMRRIAAVMDHARTPCVDAGIIGMPPKAGAAGPNFYASGPHAERFRALGTLGLQIRVLAGPIGAASALKMSYAGITKGLTAAATAMLLGSVRAGVEEALRAELEESQPSLLATFRHTVPGMFPKAYRWVAEMREIAEFAREDPAAAEIFEGAAALYERIAGDVAHDRREAEQLTRCLGLAPEGGR